MKRLFFVSICLIARGFAMQPTAAPASATPMAVQLKARDKNNVERVVGFTVQQARRLQFFAQFLPESVHQSADPVLDPLVEHWQESNDTGFVQAAKTFARAKEESFERLKGLSAGFCRVFASGFALPLPDFCNTCEIFELVRQATDDVKDEASALAFVRSLSGDQACLVYPALDFLGFDRGLLLVIENDIAQRLFNDAQFFVQSLAPVRFEDSLTKLPARAISVFMSSSLRMCMDLLPEKFSADKCMSNMKFVAADARGAHMCLSDGHGNLFVYDTQPVRCIARPVRDHAGGAGFSADGRLLYVRHCERRIGLYNTADMRLIRMFNGDRADFCQGNALLVQRFEGRGVARTSQIAVYNTQTNAMGGTVYGNNYELSPDRCSLAVWRSDPGDLCVSLYNTHTMQALVRDVPGDRYGFSPDGRLFWSAANSTDNITFYSTQDGHQVSQLAHGFNAEISQDGRLIAVHMVANDAAFVREDSIVLYRAQTMQPVGNPVRGEGYGLSPDGQLLWVCNSNQIMVYTTDNMQPVADASVPGYTVAIDSQSKRILVTRSGPDYQRLITLYDAQTMRQIDEPASGDLARFSADGRHMLMGASLFAMPRMRASAELDRCKFLGSADSAVLAIGEREDGVHVITGDRLNGAEHLAMLLASHRRQATGALADTLEEHQLALSDLVADAPEEVQRFVRSHNAGTSADEPRSVRPRK